MAVVNYKLECDGGHKALIQINAKDADSLCGVLSGKSPLLKGDKVLGKCSVCGKPLSCAYDFEYAGQLSDPDAVHEAGKKGFESK